MPSARTRSVGSPAINAVRHALQLLQSGLQARFVLATVQEPVHLYERVLPPDAEVLERVTGHSSAATSSQARPPPTPN